MSGACGPPACDAMLVGTSLSLSGRFRRQGDQARDGLQLWVEYARDAGPATICGRSPHGGHAPPGAASDSFIGAFEEAFHRPPEYPAAQAFAIGLILMECRRRCG
jgi:hypothetical protein